MVTSITINIRNFCGKSRNTHIYIISKYKRFEIQITHKQVQYKLLGCEFHCLSQIYLMSNKQLDTMLESNFTVFFWRSIYNDNNVLQRCRMCFIIIWFMYVPMISNVYHVYPFIICISTFVLFLQLVLKRLSRTFTKIYFRFYV